MINNIPFIKGDATSPQGKGKKMICHVCNDIGGWGKGFVLAISKRWEEPETAYREWHKTRSSSDFALGVVRFVKVEPTIWVANMVAQHGIKGGSQGPPIRYEALASCLKQVAEKAAGLEASIHMPQIGCGLAGGKWPKIEPLILEHLCERGLSVTVYDFE